MGQPTPRRADLRVGGPTKFKKERHTETVKVEGKQIEGRRGLSCFALTVFLIICNEKGEVNGMRIGKEICARDQ